MNKQTQFNSKFLKIFTLAILKTIQKQKTHNDNFQIIDSSLIPQLSEKLISLYNQRQAMLSELNKLNINISQQEITEPFPSQIQSATSQPKPLIPSHNFVPSAPSNITKPLNYIMKIQPLLNDPSVSSIQCIGPNSPISIIRYGRKQITKIQLTKEEIQKFLEDASFQSHIPLIEGIFNVVIDNYLIKAVYSNLITSKFTIDKNLQQFEQNGQ